MRIGIDARLAQIRKAGISRYTVQLVDALARSASEDSFSVFQGRRHREPLVTNERFQRRTLLTPPHHRLERFLLPIELSMAHLDVFHSPDFIPPFGGKFRSVITIHDLVFMLYPHFLTKDAARYYGQIDQAVRHSDAIIAVSQATKRDVVRLLGVPEGRITVIYEAASPYFRPIDTAEVFPRLRGKFGLRGDYVLFVSTIEPRKNIPNLLRAFRLFLDAYGLDVQLALAGEKGWLYEEVFQLVSDLGLTDNVRFLGRVSTEELMWLYNAAQALVAPSIYEGFGLTPLEAMACGTPVVVSNVSSLPEVVGDAGLLVDPNEPEDISVAIWRVLTDTELRESLVTKGLKRASLFSWDKAAEETLALYHSLA
jgi:glycosyltransferase involved in cell wall biosynthesis